MTRDYSDYSNSDLREALSGVDGRRYPENQAAIEAEIKARKESGEYLANEVREEKERVDRLEEKIDFSHRARPGIAWYLIISSVFLLVNALFSVPGVSGYGQAVFLFAAVSYAVAAVVGGIALLKEFGWGANLVIGVLSLQVVKITSSFFSLDILSMLRIYFSVGAGATIGVGFDFEPGFRLNVGGNEPFLLSVNVFIAWLIYIIVLSKMRSR